MSLQSFTRSTSHVPHHTQGPTVPHRLTATVGRHRCGAACASTSFTRDELRVRVRPQAFNPSAPEGADDGLHHGLGNTPGDTWQAHGATRGERRARGRLVIAAPRRVDVGGTTLASDALAAQPAADMTRGERMGTVLRRETHSQNSLPRSTRRHSYSSSRRSSRSISSMSSSSSRSHLMTRGGLMI